MKDRTLTYERLQSGLRRLGYKADLREDRIVFRHDDSHLDIYLPRLRRNEYVRPIDLLSVQNSLANGGILPKDEFDAHFFSPKALWHAIIDAEAEYHSQHGSPPHRLRLPLLQAYDLAKLGRKEFGPLSEQVMRNGINVLEKEGLLGVPVELVPGNGEFVFE